MRKAANSRQIGVRSLHVPLQKKRRGHQGRRASDHVVCFSAAAQDPSSQASSGFTEKERDARDAAPTLAGLRVLVVEDEALVAFEIEDVLTELGAVVVGTALDAEEAVRLADSLRPDCVTMDIRIQGTRDGIAAASEIWERFGIRSLLVSAYGDARTLARAAPANPIGLIPKPISKSRLAAALGAIRS